MLDPRDPDVIYATSEQRRRHVYTKIGGGPESAVYKSRDAGNFRRYQKQKGQFVPKSKFNISSAAQAEKIIETLSRWLDKK